MYYVLSLQNVHQDKVRQLQLGYIWLHVSAVKFHLNWPEDGRLRPKHVAKYNLIVTIASCLDVCCVLTYTMHYTK